MAPYHFRSKMPVTDENLTSQRAGEILGPGVPDLGIICILSGGRRISWLFFRARAKRPCLNHTGRASPADAGQAPDEIGG